MLICVQTTIWSSQTTLRPRKDIHKHSWPSPNTHISWDQVDHVAACGKFRRPVLDTRAAFRGVDAKSDYHLISHREGKAAGKEVNMPKRYNTAKLKVSEVAAC